jgi:folate-binding protein YgfZ
MHSNWQQFLTEQNAHIEQGRVLYYGDSAELISQEKRSALSSNEHVICDLSHYGLIRAQGSEAETFLQNQFCNDVRNVSTSQSQLNGYCNPKGRLLAFFRLFQRADDYYLRLPREILEPSLNRLRMFVLMTKVTLDDCSDELVHIGFSGPEAEQRLAAIAGEAPKETDEVIQSNQLTVIRIPGVQARFEIYGPYEEVSQLWQQLASQATAVGSSSWELLDIHAAIPEVLPSTQEAFVPQMLNLQAIHALSFKKGCYPGQEIVARMHYLGKLKRHMYRAYLDSQEVPAVGESLFAAGSESGQGVGRVVRAEANPAGGVDLLAVIEISSAEQRSLHLRDANGPQIQLQDLPYPLAEAK